VAVAARRKEKRKREDATARPTRSANTHHQVPQHHVSSMAVHPLTEENSVEWLKQASNQPIIVLDWDDTLLPNTHLSMLGFSDESATFTLSEEKAAELKLLENEIGSFLRACLKTGECHIVTNGMQGWVERSCERFFPSIVPLLSSFTITSARSKFEKRFPKSPVEWKIAAFTEVLGEDSSPERSASGGAMPLQVLAIGDSEHDRQAIQYVAGRASDVQLMSVKFVENPSISQLQKQLSLMGGFLTQLFAHGEALDLVLSPNMLR
ncbi:TPA: hypothetical protein N0F65_001462, partial [Lagenidium giganteum]